MDDLLADFVAESREMLEALGGEIVAWESNPGDKQRLDAIFRFVHTVKGNCGFFDFPRLASLSHAAEDALADVRAGRRQADAALVSAVLAVIDRIGDMVAAIEAGADFPAGGDEALVAGLAHDSEGADPLDATPIAATGERTPASAVQRTVRLPVQLLDQVMSSVSDLVLARNDLARVLRDVPQNAGIEAPFQRLTAVMADLRDAMTRTRMQSIDGLFALLPRFARDLSAELGKQVMIDIDGGDVELDREMIEMIRDPLTHIVRNAIDHGIEPPVKRRAAGKREIGLLSVSARQSGNQILIELADDGRGIDGGRLVEKAIAAGIVSAAEASRMTARERLGLICEPGLSTAEEVSEISGRGVGMDVVRANVERLGGSIVIASTQGVGTRITIHVPLTLTITPALTIGACGQRFAVPRSYVEEIVRAGRATIDFAYAGDRLIATHRERRLPCVDLADVLGVAAHSPRDEQVLVVLRLGGNELFVILVDEVLDHEELVVKPLSPVIMSCGLYAGTTLTDEGHPVLVLDVPGVAKAGSLDLDIHERTLSGASQGEGERGDEFANVIAFYGLDGKRKAMRMALIERIEDALPDTIQAGDDRLRIVVSGTILPLEGVTAGHLPEAGFKVFRLGDGENQIAYAFREVIDITKLGGEIVPAECPGEVEGVVLIEGQAVEIVDGHWLFSRQAPPPGTRETRVCRMTVDDPWSQRFLAPLVSAAGYRIVGMEDEAHADVAIVASGTVATALAEPHVITLRPHPESDPAEPGSIYRYDRPGLMSALRAACGS